MNQVPPASASSATEPSTLPPLDNVIDLVPHTTLPVNKISIRGEHPDHHLWNNHGTWFVHYTAYPTRLTKERVRRSLRTKDIVVARARRDRFFAELAEGLSFANREVVSQHCAGR